MPRFLHMPDQSEFLPLPAGFRMSEERRRKPKIELRTFDAWSTDGYMILKGSKHVKRNEWGECLFSSEQVQYVGNFAYCDEDCEEEFDQDLPGNPADYGHSD